MRQPPDPDLPEGGSSREPPELAEVYEAYIEWEALKVFELGEEGPCLSCRKEIAFDPAHTTWVLRYAEEARVMVCMPCARDHYKMDIKQPADRGRPQARKVFGQWQGTPSMWIRVQEWVRSTARRIANG